MLDINFIRDNVKLIEENCHKRRIQIDLKAFLALDEKRRAIIANVDEKRSRRNAASKTKPSPEEIVSLKALNQEIAKSETELSEIEIEWKNLWQKIPNMTHPDSPDGGEEDFKVLETRGTIPNFSFTPLDHEEICLKNDFLDFERGAKVSGAKFYFSKNDLVRLNLALLNYGMDILSKKNFTLLETPDIAKHEILIGAGFNPRGEEKQIYNIEGENASLVGTAEITTLGYHAGETLDFSQGMKKYAAISHCFRTEAGAYGRTSKGLYRVHQFTKLEMFIFCRPEESEGAHQELLAIEKEICDGLELPYRVIDIASGDLGGPAYRKYDIEAWMVMKNDYGEITSTSNCTDYQARRLNIRYKKENGETDFAHTLNGTALVLSRFPLAIIENFQQADGSVAVPKNLQPYFGKKTMGKSG